MSSVTLQIDGHPVAPNEACKRVMNFGQCWRGAPVDEASYRLCLPVEVVVSAIDELLPEYRSDAEQFPDRDDRLENIWRTLDWGVGARVVRVREFLGAFVEFWGSELLERVLCGDAHAGVWQINTVDSASLEGDQVVLVGCAGRSVRATGRDSSPALGTDKSYGGSPGDVSGGYLIVRSVAPLPYMDAELLPDTLVSASECMCEQGPATWSIAWSGETVDERRAKALALGLESGVEQEFIGWCTEAVDRGELGWPGVFPRLASALWVRREYFSPVEGLVVIGIGLASELAPSFEEWAQVGEGEGEPGVVTAIRRRLEPAGGGVVLGFDVLGWELGSFHSYLCNGMEVEFRDRFDIRPSEHGLFGTWEEARRGAEECQRLSDEDPPKVEEALWLPWTITRYEATSMSEVVDALPMVLSEAEIALWVERVVARPVEVADRAQALIALQDRQALHRALFPDGVRSKIEEWLGRAWVMDAAAFVDAAATLILSQDLSTRPLEKTLREGDARCRAIAAEALGEA